jgi:hypothetical protein
VSCMTFPYSMYKHKLNHLLQEYGVNCSDITIERVWSHLDVFAWGHFLGWMFKAVLVRHFGILWAISVMWEFTEVSGTLPLSSFEFRNFILPLHLRMV